MSDQQPKRVLVVDDDLEVRRLLTSTFSRANLQVDAASDGEEALALAKANRYAVVVLDLLMPVLDGFSVLSTLQSARKSAPVVIVLTGAPPEMYSSLDARLVHGIVRKPFDPDELASLVQSCAEIRSRTAMDAMAIAAAVSTPLMALLTKM